METEEIIFWAVLMLTTVFLVILDIIRHRRLREIEVRIRELEKKR